MEISSLIGMEKGQLASIVGGGGKTSLMKRLSRELLKGGKSVIVSTTTAIYEPERDWIDAIVLTGGSENVHIPAKPGITALGRQIDERGKLRGVPGELLCSIKREGGFDFIIVEADGSKGLPVKAPAQHEPAVPNCSDIVVGVVGMDCIGMPIDEEHVHRPQEFCNITGKRQGEIIDHSDIESLIMSPFGIFKNSGSARRYVLLNKAEGEKSLGHCREIANGVKMAQKARLKGLSQAGRIDGWVCGVITSSLREGRFRRIW